MEKVPNRLINQSLLNKENIDLINDFSANQNYNLLLNELSLKKIIRRNIWNCHLDTMLTNYLNDIKQEKEEINFRKSGKILFSSSYLLKAKTKRIINDSLDTQDSIEEIEEINENNFEDEILDDYVEKTEVNRHLDLRTINQKINNNEICLKSPKNMVYKAINLNDLALALTEVMKIKDKEKISRKPKDNFKEQINFLPKSLIENIKEKRENLNIRIQKFYNKLLKAYDNEPISFLDLLNKPNRQNLVDLLIYVLYLCNRKKIKIWQRVTQENNNDVQEPKCENYENLDNSRNIYISPVL
ncbi:MAG: hypothetical protein KAX10_00105 [Candidatus Lokiarchaeota archaeon]|nr:hypothetical protein [Candidatus Lokiarchaeota archaeon]